MRTRSQSANTITIQLHVIPIIWEMERMSIRTVQGKNNRSPYNAVLRKQNSLALAVNVFRSTFFPPVLYGCQRTGLIKRVLEVDMIKALFSTLFILQV